MNTTNSSQNTDFFNNHGDKLGLFLASIWIIAGTYNIYSIYKDKSNSQDLYKEFSKKNYIIISILFLLLGIVVIILYFTLNMNNNDKKQTNNIVGHISLIPFYILFLTIAIVISSGH